MEFLKWDAILGLAESVQMSVDEGRWAYLAVISIFLIIQFAKKSEHVKKNAPRYSAGAGAAIGSILSDDPAQGALGGLMVGNAASGLFSLLKSFRGPQFIGLIVFLASKIRAAVGKSDREKAKAFDRAFDRAKEEDNTEELEKWYKKNM